MPHGVFHRPGKAGARPGGVCSGRGEGEISRLTAVQSGVPDSATPGGMKTQARFPAAGSFCSTDGGRVILVSGNVPVMEQQQSLFDPSPSPFAPRPAGLALTAQPHRPLTKAQLTFNRLVTKIEKMRAKLERETLRLDAALAEYGREVHPRRQRQTALLTELVRALAPFLDDRVLKRKESAVLREIIANQLNNIAAANAEGLVDDDLRVLFKKVKGISFEESQTQAFEEMKEMMGGMFDDLGVDLDLDGLRPDMSEAEMAAHAAQMAERLEQEDGAEAARPVRTGSKRQLQKEERARQTAELRTRSIASIYKRLAKLLHPDLEPDQARKQEKVALMQELTAAYRHHDLHTLLRLEVEWIRGEQDDVARMTDEKLALYNQLLREQAANLEEEVFWLPQHPRYHAMFDPMSPLGPQRRTNFAVLAAGLDRVIASIEASVARLRTPEALAEVRGAINTYRRAGRQDPDRFS